MISTKMTLKPSWHRYPIRTLLTTAVGLKVTLSECEALSPNINLRSKMFDLQIHRRCLPKRALMKTLIPWNYQLKIGETQSPTLILTTQNVNQTFLSLTICSKSFAINTSMDKSMLETSSHRHGWAAPVDNLKLKVTPSPRCSVKNLRSKRVKTSRKVYWSKWKTSGIANRLLLSVSIAMCEKAVPKILISTEVETIAMYPPSLLPLVPNRHLWPTTWVALPTN